jgi:hypothetical protein
MLDPLQQSEQWLLRQQSHLPKDPAMLVEMARDILTRYDALRRSRGDDEEACFLSLQYEAIIWRLNDGTRSGCWEKIKWLAHELEAPDGCVPGWGQRGRFLVRVDGMRALIEYDGLEGHERPGSRSMMMHSFSATIVDVLRPFISDTGFRSYTAGCDYRQGGTVDEAAIRAIKRDMTTDEVGKPRKAKPLVYLKEQWLNQRLKEIEKDPAFGPDGWITVTKVPIRDPLPPPVQHKLAIGDPAEPPPAPAKPKRIRTRRK